MLTSSMGSNGHVEAVLKKMWNCRIVVYNYIVYIILAFACNDQV